MTDKRIIIGITGALATGKTSAADTFVAKGAIRIDADEIAHKLLLQDDDIKENVIAYFGEGVLADGEIDRRKLACVVFSDKAKLDKLSSLMHPAIIRRIKEEASRYPDKVVVLDAPLLIEAGLADYVDVVVVVACSEETQITRAIDRGISREEAQNIIKNQMPLSEKIKLADYVIDNDGKKDKMKEGVEKIWQKI